MDDKLIKQVQQILTEWNPLKELSHTIENLDDYETEAIDIVSILQIEGKVTASKTEGITREILNGAFNLYLSKEECREPSFRIYTSIKNDFLAK